MNKDPIISVIMPTYNETRSELNESIKSILNQSFKNFEYIIVDDNPRSIALKKYLHNIKGVDPRIKVVFDKKNLKEGAANNAVEVAKGTFIARMDADDIAYRNRLVNQLHFLKRNDLDFVYANFSLIDINSNLTRKETYSNNSQVNQSNVKKIMSYGNMTVGPTFFFKKDLFKRIGGYRPINGEDFDLVARFLIAGYRVGFQADPVIYKRLRKSSITYNGLLPQYIAQRTISDYLHKYHFTRIMPLSLLNNNWRNITKKQVYQFRRYVKARYDFNDKRTFINLSKTIISIIASKIVFKRCLWALINKFQEKHIK